MNPVPPPTNALAGQESTGTNENRPAPAWLGGEWVLADVDGRPPFHWSVRAMGLAECRHGGRVGFTTSGRAALRLAIAALGGGDVLVPAYGCAALSQAARDAGSQPVHYPGDGLARPDWDALHALAARTRAAIAVVVHAFGVLADAGEVRRLEREQGVRVIEDCSHTLLHAGAGAALGPGVASATVASLRKLLPVPSGGMWAVWGDARPAPTWAADESAAAADGFTAERLEAFSGAPGPERHRALQAAEATLDRHAPGGGLPPACAEIVRRLEAAPLGTAAGWRRRCADNRAVLTRALAGTGCTVLHPDLPDGICPPGLVLRHPNRTRLAARLLRMGIEATLHWPVPPPARSALSRDERVLAATILTLPCDGRYGTRDMLRVARAVREAE